MVDYAHKYNVLNCYGGSMDKIRFCEAQSYQALSEYRQISRSQLKPTQIKLRIFREDNNQIESATASPVQAATKYINSTRKGAQIITISVASVQSSPAVPNLPANRAVPL